MNILRVNHYFKSSININEIIVHIKKDKSTPKNKLNKKKDLKIRSFMKL